MKTGVVYPQIELGGDPEALDTIGRAVEKMGLDHLLMYDHVIGAVHADRTPPLNGPYTQDDPFHDPFIAFGYLAGITRRINFVTGILILPQRQTILAAKQATDVALLSGDRLRLGVGIGWNYIEYDALGQAFETRGARLNEQIPFLRRLWSESAIEWTGRFDSIDRGNIIPRPSKPIPIYVGGLSEAAYRRAAKLGDGFIFAGGDVRNIVVAWQRVQALLAEEGRSIEDFTTYCLIMDDSYGGVDPAKVAEATRIWEDAGGDYASIVTMGRGYRSAKAHLDYINEVRERI